MRILFYQWHSFMNEGVERAFNQLGVKYDTFFFQQTDWETDTGIVSLLEKKLKEKEYDIVVSVNYAPLVSMVCQREQILYVSWVYDAPIHIRNLESMKNSCNRIFFFDRIQAEGYASCGIAAYHMPLAADVETFQQYKSKEQYRTDISLVGKLYQTEYNYYLGPLDIYLRGYLDGIIQAQMKVYGGYFLGDLLDDLLLKKMNKIYHKASDGTVSVSREELEFMMACEITGRERYIALSLLSNHHDVKLYSTDKDTRLENVEYMGYADYYKQMPEVFKSSKINLNISLKIIQSGIPLRVFDVLGCGGFLLTNFQAEMPEYFSLGDDFAVYESIEDLYAKADFYLRNESERNRVARHGYETVQKYYTFKQQIEKILKQVM